MQLGKFELNVVTDSKVFTQQYAELKHGETYSLQLHNKNYSLRANAIITIDGKYIMTLRMNANKVVTLETDGNTGQKFTFYAINSFNAVNEGQYTIDPNQFGLIKVEFIPEKQVQPVSYNPYVQNRSASYRGASYDDDTLESTSKSAGITGYSGVSNQQFSTASEIELDYNSSVTIYIRLTQKQQPVTKLSTTIPPIK